MRKSGKSLRRTSSANLNNLGGEINHALLLGGKETRFKKIKIGNEHFRGN